MAVSAELLAEKLKKELEAEYVNVDDMSDGCGGKFSAYIVSKKFEGKPLLQQHRMVNSCIANEMESIHAFTMKTLTPEQFSKQSAKSQDTGEKDAMKCVGGGH
ncbi:bolA-like protein 2 [Anneissia japonica]|uniref:bolA-like protein 2 n=1 Tax=Anneissia japonica TaxID=1529436 RepID=UPI0014258A01|nr:bolA-like protein 2 [Anneissia japonica]